MNKTEIMFWSMFGLIILVIGYLVVYFILPWGSLQSAHFHRRVQVVDAEGKRDAAIALAEAEINRAKGVAQANQIIAGSITEPYLRYLFIQNVAGTANKEVIYVPTEATLPILEAGRFNQVQPKP